MQTDTEMPQKAPMPKETSSLKQYLNEGIVLIPGQMDTRKLSAAQREISALVEAGKAGKLKSHLIFFDYPSINGRLNIGQINNPFHEGFDLSNVISCIDSIDMTTVFSKYLGVDIKDYNATVMRFHVTDSRYKYAQPWHRDTHDDIEQLNINSEIKSEAIKLNVYFFDEVGFKYIPKSDKFFYNDRTNDKLIWSEYKPKNVTFYKIDTEKTASAKPGDMLFFHPELIHRGYCSHTRASLHFAFERKDQGRPEYPVFHQYKHFAYTPRDKFPETPVKRRRLLRQVSNLILYYSPLPSIKFFKSRNLHKKLRNVAFARPSVFQK